MPVRKPFTDAIVSTLRSLGVMFANPPPGATDLAGINFDDAGVPLNIQNLAGALKDFPGGGGGGGGGAMATQVISASRALTAADDYTFIVLLASDITLSIPASLPADFQIITIPFDETGGYQATGGATISGSSGFVPFTADDAGKQTELRRYPEIEGDGGNDFVLEHAASVITTADVDAAASTIADTKIAAERADFTIPQIASRQALLEQVSFAAGGSLESFMVGQMLECGLAATVTIPTGITRGGNYWLLPQPGSSFDLTAATGVTLNGVLEATEAFNYATSKIVMVGQYLDSPTPDSWWAIGLPA